MFRRGEIYYADLDPVVGSEQGGVRPVLIIQNDLGNRYSPTVIVLAITSHPMDRHITTYFEEGSYTLAHGRNIVNVILVDFRAFDTFGELTVVLLASIGAYAVLKRRGRRFRR